MAEINMTSKFKSLVNDIELAGSDQNVRDDSAMTGKTYVGTLERLRDEARDTARQRSAAVFAESEPVETDPKRSRDRPQITTTKERLNPPD
jgi:hypothetical protein